MPVFSQTYCIENRFNQSYFNSDQIEVIANIEYGNAINYLEENQKLKLDLYRPLPAIDDLEKKPLIIFIHGGGLLGGSSSTAYAQFLGEEYAMRGFVFASIDYRLGWNNLENCEGDTLSLQLAFYRAIQDTRAAIRFLKHAHNIYGIDTNYIFLNGFSVGSSVAFYTAYATQGNYYPYQYSSLGSIDSSGNPYYNHSIDIQGIIGKSTGIDTTSILDNADIPAMLFHGTCDSVVIYDTGPLYNCYTPVAYMFYHGSRDIADTMNAKGIAYQLYTNEGLAHDAVSNDTLILYSSAFLKDILCNSLLPAEYYRKITDNCAPVQDAIKNIRPNPFHNYFQINVLTNESATMYVHLYNSIGQQVIARSYYVTYPNAVLTIDVSNVPLATGVYILQTEISGRVETFLLVKD
ncbi:MAG: T9SS type A sorting domain-containing protein [Chitinophagales bacterium]